MIIDFHSHFLAGIDDGSKSVEMSSEMLLEMKKQNVNTVIATPHFYADENRISVFLENRKRAFDSLSQIISEVSVNVKLGAEVAYFEGISKAEEVDKLTIEGTSILLLELPFDKWNENIIQEIDYLIYKRKFIVVIAHLDRYMSIFGNKKYIKILLQKPLVVQINAGSILDNKRKKKALSLVKKSSNCVLGSDCHNITTRKPNLDAARKVIVENFGEEMISFIDRCGDEILNNGGK